MTDTTCLGIVEFVVLPQAHRRSAEQLDETRRAFAHRFDLRPLDDGRALAVSSDGVREISSG